MWIEIDHGIPNCTLHHVTPFAGVWIEMIKHRNDTRENTVTPFAGVWIEIKITCWCVE